MGWDSNLALRQKKTLPLRISLGTVDEVACLYTDIHVAWVLDQSTRDCIRAL